MYIRASLFAAALLASGCASLVESPDSTENAVNPAYQMQHHPVSCLLSHVLDTVANNDLQGYRDSYRWAGFEAGTDFINLRKMMILSTMPFSIRLDPPLFEISGRGEADIRKVEMALSCAPDSASGGGPAAREVRTILLEGNNMGGRMQLFFDGKIYRIVRIDWN